jgi:hypothetical protein
MKNLAKVPENKGAHRLSWQGNERKEQDTSEDDATTSW